MKTNNWWFVFIGAGFTIVSYFLPLDALPGWVRFWGPWIGLEIVAIGGLGKVFEWWDTSHSGNPASQKQGRPSASGETDYPTVRVADAEPILELFRNADDRRRLIALLEKGRINAWARSMARGPTTPLAYDTDLLAIPSAAWSTHELKFLPERGQGTRNQTFLQTKDRGYSTYYDVWLNRQEIESLGFSLGDRRIADQSMTKSNSGPSLKLFFDSVMARSGSDENPLTISVRNEGATCRVVAKVLPPKGSFYRDRASRFYFMERPARWADDHIGARELLPGESATMMIAMVNPHKRIAAFQYVDENRQIASWDLENLPVGRELELRARLFLTTDPPSDQGPLSKTVAFTATFFENGSMYVGSDPTKIVDTRE
jgi:hypothetical protein